MIKLVRLGLAALVLADWGSKTPPPQASRAVMSRYNEWTIRITPSPESDKRWRARVEVWPPNRSPQTNGGIQVHFTEWRPDEQTVVLAALESARRYIDASRTAHR